MRTVRTAGRQREASVIYEDYDTGDKLSLKKYILQDLTLLLSLNSWKVLLISISAENTENDGFVLLFSGTLQFHLVPRLRMSGAMPTLRLYAFMVWTGKTLPFFYILPIRIDHIARSQSATALQGIM
jgi:hypothetical protein